jgi:hypothetical protein
MVNFDREDIRDWLWVVLLCIAIAAMLAVIIDTVR